MKSKLLKHNKHFQMYFLLSYCIKMIKINVIHLTHKMGEMFYFGVNKADKERVYEL